MWSDPEVETVAPGIHRAPVPLPSDGLRAVNVYVVEDGDGIVLVDAGWDGPAARTAVEAGLAAAGAGIGDVRTMLITHLHYDHLGQATALRRAGAGAYRLGAGERQGFLRLTTDPVASRLDRLDQLAAFGAVELAERGRARPDALTGPVDWEPPARWLADGDALAVSGGELVATATPGHTRGHLCFEDRGRRLLFAGDHVLPHITPSIGLEPDITPLALLDFMTSLEAVRGLDVDLVLPAHGEVFTDLPGRVDALLVHHEDRLAACAALIGGTDSRTPFDVALALPWTRRLTPFSDLDGFNQVLAVWEAAAHLELLVARGLLVRAVVDGVVRFSDADPA